MHLIEVDGTATVDDLLRALGLEAIPDGCELRMDDDVKIVVSADAEALRDEIEDMFGEEPESISLPHLRDAIAALRDGHPRTAMVLFDSVFGGTLSPEMGVIEGALLSRGAA